MLCAEAPRARHNSPSLCANLAIAAGAMKKGRLLFSPIMIRCILTRETLRRTRGRREIFFQSRWFAFNDSRLSAAEWKYVHARRDSTFWAANSISSRFSHKWMGIGVERPETVDCTRLVVADIVSGSTGPRCSSTVLVKVMENEIRYPYHGEEFSRECPVHVAVHIPP